MSSSEEPLIACLCPTYKRPDMLRNAIACFNAQRHPNRLLVVFDDAGQFAPSRSEDGRVIVLASSRRRETLPAKYNEMLGLQRVREADVIAVWEDDDVFCPWHLSNISEAFQGGKRFIRNRDVMSTYSRPVGFYQTEECGCRFHSSWAFARTLIDSVGGWPFDGHLDWDQKLFGLLERSSGDSPITIADGYWPSYCYRWGRGVDPWNGSQAGEDGWKAFWNSLALKPAPYQGVAVGRIDAETDSIIARAAQECGKVLEIIGVADEGFVESRPDVTRMKRLVFGI